MLILLYRKKKNFKKRIKIKSLILSSIIKSEATGGVK